MSERTSFVSALAESKPLVGTLVSVRSPEVAEALSLCGFDWLFVDLEHSMIDIAAAQGIVQAVGSKAFTVLRLPDNNPEHFKKALDTGCDGVIVPLINSADEARAAVLAAKYPPLGARSVGIGRAHGYGYSFGSYVETANALVALILQIEHRLAVDAIEDILAVKGFDGIFIGPYDLSASMGLLGQVTHPDVVAAIEKVRQACRQAKVPFGIFCSSVSHAAAEIEQGATFVVCGTDLMLMTGSASANLRELRAVSN
jgi:2-keto-3-deoxy-L-rhamnonate aldolase RhmA